LNSPKPITLVLLPGMDGTGLLFAPFVRALPEWVKPVVVAYPADRPLDYRGHLAIVMAALPVEEPFVILGESFSGALALMAAARKPRGLCGVVLSATFVSWPLPFAPFFARLIVSLGLFRLKSTRLFLRIVLGSNASAELGSLFPLVLAKLAAEVLSARARAVMALDCREELRACPVPVLALVAKRDRIVNSRCPRLMQQVRPDMEFTHIDSPHLILQLATVEAVDRICRFLSAVGGGEDLNSSPPGRSYPL